MKTLKITFFAAAIAGLVIVIAARQPAADAVNVDPTDIGGVVTSSKAPRREPG